MDKQRTKKDFVPGIVQSNSSAVSDPIGDVLRAEMIAYWRFEEAGGNRIDATGNGHNGVSTNNPGNASAKVGNGANLDRTLSQKFTVSDHADLRNNGNLYIFGWVKLTALADGESYNGATIIGKTDGDLGLYEYELYYYRAGIPIDHQFAFYITSNEANDGGSVDSASGITADTFYFIEAYYDASTRELGIAINNGAFTTGTLSGLLGPDITSAPVLLGTDPASNFWYASAVFDEFGFMKPASVPLTQEQRDYLYNSGTGRTLYP